MRNWTALAFASFEGHSEIVKLLLAQDGINVNCKTIGNQNNSSYLGVFFFSMILKFESIYEIKLYI